MKRIVIVGAGFSGISAALRLSRNLQNTPNVSITVIDRQPYHLFHANLYELATSPEELTAPLQLKNSITIPLQEIFKHTGVQVLQAAVERIEPNTRRIMLRNGTVAYDYLLLATGSVSNFFGIEGVGEHSLQLLSLTDALRIRNQIESLIQNNKYEIRKKPLRIAIGGGGFTGVELAAEMQGYLNFLAWQYNYPREKIETLVIEGGNRLLPAMDEKVSRVVAERLHHLGVRVQLESFISHVDKEFVEFKNGERLTYDALIWTAGVKAAPLLLTKPVELDKGGRVLVNANLQIPEFPNIFVAGDQTCFLDTNHRPLPPNARQAKDQALYVASAIGNLVHGNKLTPYLCKDFSYIITVGGTWAVWRTKYFVLSGFAAYLIRSLSFIQYFSGLLGIGKAILYVWFDTKLYRRND